VVKALEHLDLVTGRLVGILDDFTNTLVKSNPFTWSNDIAYTVTLTRKDSSYTCTAVDPGGVRSTVSGTSNSSPNQPTVIVRAFAVTARVNWVLVVRSP
jgi:hypothetical protein